MPDFFSRQEAAEYLGISVSVLDEAKNARKITFIQYVDNGRVFFLKEHLDEYITNHTHAAYSERRPATYRKPWK